MKGILIMQNKTKLKYITQTVLKRFLIYLALSFLGYGVLASEITSIRNDVYGIGSYINTRAVTGMLIALNIIFLFIYILFLFFTKKHLYTVENIKSGKLKEYVRFEVALELAITLGYIIISAIASIFVTNASILAGLLVPVYCLYYFMRNVFVATATTAATCIILLFIILVLPYTKKS